MGSTVEIFIFVHRLRASVSFAAESIRLAAAIALMSHASDMKVTMTLLTLIFCGPLIRGRLPAMLKLILDVMINVHRIFRQLSWG